MLPPWLLPWPLLPWWWWLLWWLLCRLLLPPLLPKRSSRSDRWLTGLLVLEALLS